MGKRVKSMVALVGIEIENRQVELAVSYPTRKIYLSFIFIKSDRKNRVLSRGYR